MKNLGSPQASSPATTTVAKVDSGGAGKAVPLTVEVGEILVRNGAVAWRDETVSPVGQLDLSSIEARVTEASWPLRGPVSVRVALRPPGGGQLRLAGRVGLDPLTADLRVVAKDAELAPYQPYLPTPARIRGAADLDLAVVLPPLTEGRATARGNATLSRVDVRDGERTVMRAERAAASGLEIEWPERVAINRLALVQPWVLLERDQNGVIPQRALLTPPSAPGASPPTADTPSGAKPLAITVARLTVDEGGIRVVDRAISPPFAVDLQAATLRMDGLSTAPARP